MKTLLLATLISAAAGELIDLGTITPNKAWVLERNTSRPDFSHFEADLLSLAPTSNRVTLVLTNDLLTITNLAALPSGPTIMSLTSICEDGSESEPVLFKLDIRRAEPPPPSIRVIELIDGSDVTNRLQHAMRNFRKRRLVNEPSVPGATNIQVGSPLPNARSRTYGQWQDAQVK